MSGSALPDPNTHFGARVARRLADDIVIWLTTVGRDGTPQPNPVWDGEFLVYNLPTAARVGHVTARSRVSLNFDGNRQGGDIVIFTGSARISETEPPPDEHPAYLAKYDERMVGEAGSVGAFASRYSLPLRIQVDRVRGF